MNILIYIPHLKKEFGGVWQYTTGLLKILSADRSNKYIIYHNGHEPEIAALVNDNPQFKLINDEAVRRNGFSIRQLFVRLLNRVAHKLHYTKENTGLSDADLICMQYHIDIIHCPVQYIPVTAKAKLITTLHDVQELHFPENFSAEDRAYRASAYLDFVRRADAIVVSYEHIKKDLIKYFQVDEQKVRVILLDMQKLWFEKFAGKDVVDLAALGIPKKFLLYPATTWKHKNHIRLIEAVSMAKETHNTVINLVCTGHKDKHYPEIERLVKMKGLQDQVYFTGIVDEPTLFSLYETCRGVVIPTLYEAGSFPLIESILLGVPVICSNVTSLPETIASGEFLFDPYNPNEICDQMIRLWSDEGFRERNHAQIKNQQNRIRMNNSFENLMTLYSSLSSN